MTATMGATNIDDVLDGHVPLEVECVDRLILNAYVPNLQVGGQVARFITQHLGKPIASAAGRAGPAPSTSSRTGASRPQQSP